MSDTEATNQRVTNAILKKDIEHLTNTVTSYCNKSDKRDEDYEKRLRCVEKEQTKLKTIVGFWNSLNSLGVVALVAFKSLFSGE